MKRVWVLTFLILGLVLGAEPSAKAQELGIILSQPTLTGAPGTTLTFVATVTNLTTGTICQ